MSEMARAKYTRFQDVPQLTRHGNWECDFPLDSAIRQIREWEAEPAIKLDMNPDFQRAHVWTEAQQVAWLEFFLRGGKTGRVLYFNHPGWSQMLRGGHMVVVDGKQRIEAMRRFVDGEIQAYGSYLCEFTDHLRITQTLRVNVNDLRTRAEVLQWYIEFNAGGTPHTEDEIDRVRLLLQAEHAKESK